MVRTQPGTDQDRLRNFPPQPTPLLGRQQEITLVRAQLIRGDVRLVTLTGPPGVGKTRLALAVAARLAGEFEHGAVFVDLTPLTDPGLVAAAIAHALGVREDSGAPLLTLLRQRLETKSLLLVLDNFERVLTGASEVANLLASCPRLKVLVTSRERLHLGLEHEYTVPSLDVPDLRHLPALETLSSVPAMALFLERGRSVKPGFELTPTNARAVAEICTHLDGLPLAIELAAARINLLPPVAMLVRLQDWPALLSADARDRPARHRTLRSAIAWSYNLLKAAEQTLFRRLAVFVAGCTLTRRIPYAQSRDLQVDVRDMLASLVDKHLLKQEPVDGGTRFHMLATIREYGLDLLEASGEYKEIQRRHAGYFLNTAEKAGIVVGSSEHSARLPVLEQDHDNIRAALRVFAECGEWETALRLATALAELWFIRGYLHEGRRWINEALKRTEGCSGLVRAWGLLAAGRLAFGQGDFTAAQAFDEESLAIFQQLGDKSGIARSKNFLAVFAWGVRNDPGLASSLAEESLVLFREIGDRDGVARSLLFLGESALGQDDFVLAGERLQESLAIRRGMGDKRGIAAALQDLAEASLSCGDCPRARALLEEVVALYVEVGDRRSISMALGGLGDVALVQDRQPEARACFEKGLAMAREIGADPQIAQALSGLGRIAFFEGDYRGAGSHFEEHLTLRRRIGNKAGVGNALLWLGRTVLYQGDYDRAATLLEESVSILKTVGAKARTAWALSDLGLAVQHQGDPHRAVALCKESLVLRQELGDTPGIAECLERLAAVDESHLKLRRAARLMGAAEALREAAGAPPSATDGLHRERTVSALRSRLGSRTLSAAWAEGRRMSIEQVIEQALAVQPAHATDSAKDGSHDAKARPLLSHREEEVAVLVAQGLSNREIANVLAIAEGTAQNHVQRILNKLRFNSRTQIAAWTVGRSLPA